MSSASDPRSPERGRGSSHAARAWAVLLALLASAAWADHGAPAPRLGGVSFCTDSSSVQTEVVGAGEAQQASLARALAERALQRLREQLSRSEAPHRQAEVCTGEAGYVVLELYARYLDPETYLGFPEDSYTYVAATQVGAHDPARPPEAALLEGVYIASTSDILQAPNGAELQAQLLELTEAQGQLLVQTWREANLVPAQRLARFGVLAVALALLRGVTLLISVRR